MSVEVISEVWQELKRYIVNTDHADAAETLVNILIDNDIHTDDIRQAFKGDSNVKRILSDYMDDDESEEEEEDQDSQN